LTEAASDSRWLRIHPALVGTVTPRLLQADGCDLVERHVLPVQQPVVDLDRVDRTGTSAESHERGRRSDVVAVSRRYSGRPVEEDALESHLRARIEPEPLDAGDPGQAGVGGESEPGRREVVVLGHLVVAMPPHPGVAA